MTKDINVMELVLTLTKPKDDEIAKLKDENKKLRHVLEVIADGQGYHDHSLTYDQAIEYAKEALQ
jgi:hypothetical protein